MLIARIIIESLLALLLVGTGGGKLLQAASSLAIRDSLKLSNRMWRTIGSLEIAAVIGLIAGIWFPITALLASAGVVALMIGAIVARSRAGQRTASPYIADVAVLLLAIASITLCALAL